MKKKKTHTKQNFYLTLKLFDCSSPFFFFFDLKQQVYFVSAYTYLLILSTVELKIKNKNISLYFKTLAPLWLCSKAMAK